MTKNSTAAVAGVQLLAGAAASDITPRGSVFLYGYPHVPRQSSGVEDPLMASALALTIGPDSVLFISVDVIFVTKDLVREVRHHICEQTDLEPHNIMVAATHTHSGPVTLRMVSNLGDPVVPEPDPDYLEQLKSGIVAAGLDAWQRREPAEIAHVRGECPEVGGNRHTPTGETISQIPILFVRSSLDRSRMMAVMYASRVHPTVLHEQSTMISGDFPGLCRRHLQREHFGEQCVVLSHLGAAGDQSPRHAVRSNTMDEADRLGGHMAASITDALRRASFDQRVRLRSCSQSVNLPLRRFPTVSEAAMLLDEARERMRTLQNAEADAGAIRTAECAVFGAEETLCLAELADSGDVQAAADSCLPAEIQLLTCGDTLWVAWPGEVFADFALRVYEHFPEAAVVTLANGELQGYLVTAQALADHSYEASNALFASPCSGGAIVELTLSMLRQITADAPASEVS